jgi:hypothetical protein
MPLALGLNPRLGSPGTKAGAETGAEESAWWWRSLSSKTQPEQLFYSDCRLEGHTPQKNAAISEALWFSIPEPQVPRTTHASKGTKE